MPSISASPTSPARSCPSASSSSRPSRCRSACSRLRSSSWRKKRSRAKRPLPISGSATFSGCSGFAGSLDTAEWYTPSRMAWTRGKVVALEHQSEVLRGNALGDPAVRTLHVYTPPGYGEGQRYPVVFLPHGFTGTGASYLSWSAWQEPLPQRLDRLIGSGDLPPCLVALPDCFTRLGGSQYVNSPAQGRYLDYLCDELVPAVDRELATLGDGGRAVAGKSSGGIGAVWACLER